VRYTGFAPSRELGAAVAGFSPLVATWLLGVNDDKPWLVAAFFVGLSLISLVAFLYSRETKGVDMEEVDPVQDELVTAATEPRELAMNR
jgi:MFS transporter, MHS family, shikimate and dehydroshikimate transport protein